MKKFLLVIAAPVVFAGNLIAKPFILLGEVEGCSLKELQASGKKLSYLPNNGY